MSVRMAFSKEAIQTGRVVAVHTAGKENPADIFTKNVDRKTFLKHKSVILNEIRRQVKVNKLALGSATEEITENSGSL